MVFRPLVITSVISGPDFFWVSSDLRSFAFKALPDGVLPLPSSPWHRTHFDLNNAAASLWAKSQEGQIAPPSRIKRRVREVRFISPPSNRTQMYQKTNRA